MHRGFAIHMDIFNDLNAQEEKFTGLLSNFSEEDKTYLQDAYTFAKDSHNGQYRDDGVDYIIHPLRAANTLLEDIGIVDTSIIAATLMHDVLEDCDVSEEVIRNKFGDKACDLTKALTRPRPENETTEDKKKSKAAKFLWYVEKASDEACLIKCADLYDNMKSWEYIPEGNKTREKFPRWCGEVKQWYVPLAKKAHPRVTELFTDLITSYSQLPQFAPYL